MNCIIEQSARGYDTLAIEALLATKRRIFLTNLVDSTSCAEIIRQLMFFNSEDSASEIVLYINTPGGEVDSGFAVYDTMRLIEAPVRTVCIGVCASMGALIYLGGERREMLPHSRLMIHDPSFSGGSYAGKKPHELQAEVNKLNETRTRSAVSSPSARGELSRRSARKPRPILISRRSRRLNSVWRTPLLKKYKEDAYGKFKKILRKPSNRAGNFCFRQHFCDAAQQQ